MVVCSSCGSENAAGAKFCEECGARLVTACSGCGAPLAPTAKFCRECGTPNNAGPRRDGGGGLAHQAADVVGHQETSPVAERRLVSVLFADLVGFTTIAERRDAEETRELLSRYFDLARDVVERYGGAIEKFIGDAVMAVWGAPIAQEDDAERAVRAALDLVASVRDLGSGIQARAGVLTGEAAVTIGAVGQGMVAGDLVNTASRLQSVATPGTVLVGEATQRAAGLAIAFEPAGEQTLKGKAAPVAAFRAMRVVAERGGRNRAETLEAPFVGRDEELRLLKELFHATSREGRARLVSVIGPAGIGKSRLAWEFSKYVDGLAEAVWWHVGRSPAYGEGITFWALGEMVRRRCNLRATDDEPTTRASVAAMLDEHVRDEGERRWIESALLALLGIGTGPTDRSELFAAWRTFFERLSESGAVALVFEDFNNADAGLIDFVDHLLEWSRARPIYVVTLARPELLERRPDWHAKRNFSSVALEPLPDGAMRELLEGLVPGLTESAVRAIVARADGVPLYAVETVRALLAEGKLALREGRYLPVGDLANLAVPETLTALIASRLDALDPGDRAVVHDAAVLGQSFTLGGLVAVTGLPDAELAPRLQALVRREFLTISADPRAPERGQYGFVQALIREVAYNTLAKRDRKRRHLAAARWLESLGNEELAGALAGHYLAAYENSPAGAEADALAAQAHLALRAAGDRATLLGSYEQAARFYEQAVAVPGDADQQAALLERAGEAWTKAARYENAIGRLREALDLRKAAGDRRPVARTSAALGRAIGFAYRRDEAVAHLRAALEEFSDLADEEVGVELLVSYARVLAIADAPAEAAEVAERALISAERLEVETLIVGALLARGGALGELGRSYEGIAILRACVELAEEMGLASDALAARSQLGVAASTRDPVSAVEIYRAGLADARRLGLRGREVGFLGNGAEAARWTGDWSWALAELAAVLASDLDARDRPWLEQAQVILNAWRGEDVTASEAAVRDAYAESGQPVAEVFDLESCLALAQCRPAEARTAAREVARLSPLNAPAALGIACRGSAWMRDSAGLRDDLEALVATGARGPILTVRRTAAEAALAALEGRADEARRLYGEALRGLLDRRIYFEAALLAIDMAIILGPEDPSAVAAARDARPILERLGARPFLAILEGALAHEPVGLVSAVG